jgi:hypothetical protein
MCIDFRKLNDRSTKDKYPISRMDEIIDEMANAKIFSTLNVTSVYYQIKKVKEDREKTAFRWRNGFYEYARMVWFLE